MILRGYQSRAVHFLLPLKRGFVVAPAGSGKTLIAASAASSVFRPFDRVVWLANTREQVQQAKDAIGKVTWPNPVEIEVRCVAGRPDLSDADIVIVDECFPAGTVIDGRPIESIRIGEHVRTLNHQTQQIESRPVLSVFERQYDGAMYRCSTRSGRSFVCTEGHPIYVRGVGYVPAKALHGLWKSVSETLEVLGCSQDGDPEFDRLDCVEVLEQGSGRRRAGVRGESRVYNLHVEGNENYFAGGVLVHNCHHLPALSWSEVIIKATGIVWGFSATPWSGDWQRDDSLKAFFEGNFITIPRSEVLEGGSITPGIVHTHDLDREGEFQAEIDQQASVLVADRRRRFRFTPIHELQRRALWEVTQQKVRLNPRRNQRIIELANQGQGVLVLVGSIDHGELLSSQISDSVVVHSKMGPRKRKAAIEAARHGALRCMVATSLADEGLDVPRLETVILAAGGRSAGKLEQRTGRVMRPSEGKLRGVVHDFVDRGASLAYSQFKARMRTYKKLGYTIQK